MANVHLGCAGWSLPRAAQPEFPATGSHLQRYASLLNATEINSSFHRSHRAATYARWAGAVPAEFRFCVKVPRFITHERRLQGVAEPFDKLLSEVAGLGEKLGCLLVQLPPSLVFDATTVEQFLELVRSRLEIAVACEPRHPSWFEDAPDHLLKRYRVARVAADPAKTPAAATPGGWRGLSYYRLHGYPKMYYSTYEDQFIATLSQRLREDAAARRTVWCIFDNTTLGGATRNALDLRRLLG